MLQNNIIYHEGVMLWVGDDDPELCCDHCNREACICPEHDDDE